SHVVLAVDQLEAPPGWLPDPHRAVDTCTVFLGPEVEAFPGYIGDDLEVFHKEVALVLCAELRPLPSLRDVIHLPECRGTVLDELLLDKTDHVGHLQEVRRALCSRRCPEALLVPVLPDLACIIVLNIVLRTGGK